MNHPVGQSVFAHESVDRGRQARRIVDIQREGHGPLQALFADEGLGLPGEIETEHLGALMVEFGGDGGAQIAGAAGHPDGFSLKRMPGFHCWFKVGFRAQGGGERLGRRRFVAQSGPMDEGSVQGLVTGSAFRNWKE